MYDYSCHNILTMAIIIMLQQASNLYSALQNVRSPLRNVRSAVRNIETAVRNIE